MDDKDFQIGLQETLFPGLCPITAAVGESAGAGADERGAVFTRREVVDFILDLAGYSFPAELHRRRLLEPSFGGGDFLVPAVGRLLDSWRTADPQGDPAEGLRDCVRAVELHRESFLSTRRAVGRLLEAVGLARSQVEALLSTWLINGDFLLTPLDGPFDIVIGNPPYVRQELIADVLLAEYRRRYQTLFDRADLYVPFIERSLRSLSEGGRLGFICADRWMKNRYGGPLRRLVAERFHLQVYVNMVDTKAFHSDVIAYPAITIISREASGPTRVAYRPEISANALSALSRELVSPRLGVSSTTVRELAAVTDSDEPWVLESSDQLAVVRRLEAEYPTVEEAGCKVGIGVATGADQAFVGPFDTLDVEQDRKLPLVMTRDIQNGVVEWRGFGVINPFADEGGLVDLARYPKLKKYLEAHRNVIARRHVARRTPENWYRTIDRINPALAQRPKLLIPDIKGKAHVVYEDGQLYPHHNLYFITSGTWELHALRAVLLSGIARLFVAVYSTKMRGGFLRFQAQYLRRIRLPRFEDIAPELGRNLSMPRKEMTSRRVIMRHSRFTI